MHPVRGRSLLSLVGEGEKGTTLEGRGDFFRTREKGNGRGTVKPGRVREKDLYPE